MLFFFTKLFSYMLTLRVDFLFYFLSGSEKQYKWNVDQLTKMCQDWESTYRSACEVNMYKNMHRPLKSNVNRGRSVYRNKQSFMFSFG